MRLSSSFRLFSAIVLLLPLAAFADESRGPKGLEEKVIDGRSTMEFTKIWTDDYGNYHKEIYRAYFETLKNRQGEEIEVEVKHGPFTAFHKNGHKSWAGEFRHGKRVGDYLYWGKNGSKTGEASFKDGEMHGVYRQWHSDGRLMREETYDRGKLHGEMCYWDEDGNVLTTGIFRDDMPWSGKFVQLDSQPVAQWVIREFAEGKEVGVEKLTGRWWW